MNVNSLKKVMTLVLLIYSSSIMSFAESSHSWFFWRRGQETAKPQAIKVGVVESDFSSNAAVYDQYRPQQKTSILDVFFGSKKQDVGFVKNVREAMPGAKINFPRKDPNAGSRGGQQGIALPTLGMYSTTDMALMTSKGSGSSYAAAVTKTSDFAYNMGGGKLYESSKRRPVGSIAGSSVFAHQFAGACSAKTQHESVQSAIASGSSSLSSPNIRRVGGEDDNPEIPFPDDLPVGDTPYWLFLLLALAYGTFLFLRHRIASKQIENAEKHTTL